jgi:hypothetical protein
MTVPALSIIPPPATECAERLLSRLANVTLGEAPGIWYADCPVVHDDASVKCRVWLNLAHTRVHASCPRGCTEATIRDAVELAPADLYVMDKEVRRKALAAGTLPASKREIEEGRRLPPATCALYAPSTGPIAMVIEKIWPQGEIGLLVGDDGSFKSTAALAMAAAVAGGYPVWGYFQCEQRPVLIVSAEDQAEVVQMRLEALCEGAGWDKASVLVNTHYITEPSVSLSDPQWQAHIAAEAKRVEAGFIVLDPLADLLDGDENSNSDVRPVMKYCRALARGTMAAVAIVHHLGKPSEGKATRDRIRGASALRAAARTVLYFNYLDSGVTVEHLKMSRAPRLPKFVLARRIEVDKRNPTTWISANLSYQDAKTFALNQAETFVMTQLRQSPGLTTDALRQAARHIPGVNNEALSNALSVLQSRDWITFEPGPNTSKKWYANAA